MIYLDYTWHEDSENLELSQAAQHELARVSERKDLLGKVRDVIDEHGSSDRDEKVRAVAALTREIDHLDALEDGLLALRR